MADRKPQHKTLAETGRAPGNEGSGHSKRFAEGGYVKHKQTTHLVHGAPLGFKQMPHATGSHEQRSHLKGGGKAKC